MNWTLAAEVSGSIIGGLIIVPSAMATVRAILHDTRVPWVSGDVAIMEARAAKEGWPHRSLVAFDIACNVILLRGQQDETISTHAYRAFLKGKTWGRIMNAWLNLFQPDHGLRAASGDLERAFVRVSVLQRILGVK